MRKALLIIGLAGLACGSQETGTSPDAGVTGGETPAVSAVQPPSDAAIPEESAEAVEAVEVDQAGDAVEVTTCLGLVTDGKFAEAVVACQTAIELYPDSTKAAEALAKATASAGAAGAGAAGAAGAAAGSAAERATQ